MFCHLSALTVCNAQTELAVTVTCQYNILQINLQLQSIKMHDAKLIRQAYYTICLNDSSHAESSFRTVLSEVLGFVAYFEHTTVAKPKQEASQISFY